MALLFRRTQNAGWVHPHQASRTHPFCRHSKSTIKIARFLSVRASTSSDCATCCTAVLRRPYPRVCWYPGMLGGNRLPNHSPEIVPGLPESYQALNVISEMIRTCSLSRSRIQTLSHPPLPSPDPRSHIGEGSPPWISWAAELLRIWCICHGMLLGRTEE